MILYYAEHDAYPSIEVVILELGGMDLTSAECKLMFTLVSATAEMERDLLVERAQAKAARVKVGGASRRVWLSRAARAARSALLPSGQAATSERRAHCAVARARFPACSAHDGKGGSFAFRFCSESASVYPLPLHRVACHPPGMRASVKTTYMLSR